MVDLDPMDDKRTRATLPYRFGKETLPTPAKPLSTAARQHRSASGYSASRKSRPIVTARDVINAHIGARLRALRLACGKTQVELGEVLGLSNQQVQKYEKGVNSLNLERVWMISRYFGVDIAYFLDGLDEAAQGAMLGFPALEERPDNHRRRLALAEALQRIRSPSMLRGLLQLLHAVEDDQRSGAEDGDL
jgi:transcriptional regulator with XRE-family HTH domain